MTDHVSPIGSIIALQGQVWAESESGVRPLETGSPVYQGEKILTGPDSNTEIRFLDDTCLSQGANSALSLDHYVYNPADEAASNLGFGLLQGAFRHVSGKIAVTNPENVQLESPLAVIGIRGTTTVHSINPENGVETHGVEHISDGHRVIVQDSFGEIRIINDPLTVIDLSAEAPMGFIRPMTPQELEFFQSFAPGVLDLLGTSMTPEGLLGSLGGAPGEAPADSGDEGAGESEGDGAGAGEENAGGEEVASDAASSDEATDGDGELAAAGTVPGDTGNVLFAGPSTTGIFAYADQSSDGSDLGLFGATPALTGSVAGTTGSSGPDLPPPPGASGGTDSSLSGAASSYPQQESLLPPPEAPTGSSSSISEPSNWEYMSSGGNPNYSWLPAGYVAVPGTDGGETLEAGIYPGGAGPFALFGFGGDDQLSASANHMFYGGAGNDTIIGSSGADTIYGGTGDDLVLVMGAGEAANDVIDGGAGANTLKIYAGSQIQNVFASDAGLMNIGNIELLGDAAGASGLDLSAQSEAFLIEANSDREVVILSGAGNDTIIGGLVHSSEIHGGGGNDSLVGGDEDDSLSGEASNDILEGWEGADSMTGGLGADRFMIYEPGDLGGDDIDGTQEQGTFDRLALVAQSANQVFDLTAVASIQYIDRVDIVSDLAGTEVILGATIVATADSNGDGVLGDIRVQFRGEGASYLQPMFNAVIIDGRALPSTQVLHVEGENYNQNGFAGDDTMYGGAGADTLEGGDGQDSIEAGAGADSIRGGLGNDRILGQVGNDSIDGGAGNDSIFGGDDNDTIVGGAGADYIDGGAGLNYLFGGDDNDTLLGGVGNETLSGGAGVDSLSGGGGNDIFNFQAGDVASGEFISGGEGTDTVRIEGSLDFSGAQITGIEYISITSSQTATFGTDTFNDSWHIMGTVGTAETLRVVLGSAGESVDFSSLSFTDWTGADLVSVLGGTGNDTILGSAVNNLIDGGAGNDSLDCGPGNDTILGGTGNDSLYGWTGTDSLVGGDGDDTIEGAAGADILTGGAGNDQFVYTNLADSKTGDGIDTITDFTSGQDTIRLAGLSTEESFFYRGAGAFSGTDAQARFDTGTNMLLIDVDGNGTEDMRIHFSSDPSLVQSDFVWDLTSPSGAPANWETYVQQGGTPDFSWFTDRGFMAFYVNVLPDIDNGLTILDPGVDYAMFGFDGDDTLDGSDASSTGDHMVYGGAGADTILGGSGDSTIYGGTGNDTITGGAGFEDIDGGAGNDSILGGAGDDWIVGSEGADTVDGQGDRNTIDYFMSDNAVIVDLELQTAHGGWAEGDVLSNIHNLYGSYSGDDTLIGSTGENIIGGSWGNDSIQGLGGDDWIEGAQGNDTITGGDDDDFIQGDGEFEDVNDGDDLIFGGDGHDEIVGGGGDDELNGGIGNDTITGGTGFDTLTGGLDNDVFIFSEGSGNTVDMIDIIMDFTSVDDRVDTDMAGTAANYFEYAFAGSGVLSDAVNAANTAFSGNSDLKYYFAENVSSGDSYIVIDWNGDHTSDQAIMLADITVFDYSDIV